MCTPAENEKLKALNRTNVMKPCFSRFRLAIYSLWAWMIFAIRNSMPASSSYERDIRNMMLQLLRNVLAIPIYF